MIDKTSIRKPTTGMPDFPRLIEDGAKYIDKTAAEAVGQARTKDYAGPWLDGKAPVFLVGVNYDPAKRGIDDPVVEEALYEHHIRR